MQDFEWTSQEVITVTSDQNILKKDLRGLERRMKKVEERSVGGDVARNDFNDLGEQMNQVLTDLEEVMKENRALTRQMKKLEDRQKLSGLTEILESTTNATDPNTVGENTTMKALVQMMVKMNKTNEALLETNKGLRERVRDCEARLDGRD